MFILNSRFLVSSVSSFPRIQLDHVRRFNHRLDNSPSVALFVFCAVYSSVRHSIVDDKV